MERVPSFEDARRTYNEEDNLEKFSQAMEAVKAHISILEEKKNKSKDDDNDLSTLRAELILYEEYFSREAERASSAPRLSRSPAPARVLQTPEKVEMEENPPNASTKESPIGVDEVRSHAVRCPGALANFILIGTLYA